MVFAATTQEPPPPLIVVAQVSEVPVPVPVLVSNVVAIATSIVPVGAIAKQTVNGAAP
jgi:hypothetical protein